MKWIISRGGKILCVTSVPYPAAILRDMRAADYKITTKN